MCRSAARAAASACAYEDEEAEVAALAPGATAMTRPRTGAQAAMEQDSKRGRRRRIRFPLAGAAVSGRVHTECNFGPRGHQGPTREKCPVGRGLTGGQAPLGQACTG